MNLDKINDNNLINNNLINNNLINFNDQNFEIVEYTKRLLLYLNMAYIADVYDTDNIKKYPLDVIIKTSASLTAEAIEYLLSMAKITTIYNNYYLRDNKKFYDFDPKYIYTVFFQCMNKVEYTIDEKITSTILSTSKFFLGKNESTKISHEIVLINMNNQWYMFHSYIGVKNLTREKIDINTITQFIYDMRNNFNLKNWNDLFNINEADTNAKTIYCVINKYIFENKIEQRYQEIIQDAKHKLHSEIEGIMLPYLYLLDKNLDINGADNYLNMIAELKN